MLKNKNLSMCKIKILNKNKSKKIITLYNNLKIGRSLTVYKFPKTDTYRWHFQDKKGKNTSINKLSHSCQCMKK